MIAAGLVESGLLWRRANPDCRRCRVWATKTIPVVQGRIPYQAVDLLKKRTRHYAKRQETWFRREPVERWFLLRTGEEEKSYQKILEFIEGRIKRVSNKLS